MAVAVAATPVRPPSGLLRAVAMPLSSWATHFGFRLVALWLVIAAFFLFRLARAVSALQELKRMARPIGDAPATPALETMVGAVRDARVAVSDRIAVPSAVGFAQPMVLLPQRLVERLEAEDLYAAVAHEIAHLRRWDDVTQIAQQVCLALLFFNPVMHLVARRVDFFREAACDDASVTSRASALRYAQCLATILAHLPAARRSMAPALMHRGRQVVARVERLIDWKEESHTMGRAVLLIALGICTAALFFVRVELPLLTPHDREQNAHNEVIVVSDNSSDDSLLSALSAAGYRPTVDDVIALSNAGVDADTVSDIRRSGLERPSISELVELQDAGVDGDLIDQAVHVFGSGVAVEDLIRLQNHGVDPDDFAALRSLSCTDSSPVSDVIALHDAGVDGDYVRHLSEKGLQHLSVRDVIRLHDAGVDV
jgi:beta-lactamase regulating signal transducer with metallopeptidase domain